MNTSEQRGVASADGDRPRARAVRTIGRKVAVTAAVAVAVAGGAVAVASPASAAGGDPYISSNSGGANLRAQPNTGAYSEEYLRNGTPLLMICYIDAQTVSPPNSNYTSARWFRVEPTYDPNVGYVHSSLVTRQVSVGRC